MSNVSSQEIKVWCVDERHGEPCPDADTCLACMDECAACEGDTAHQFMGTYDEAVEEMGRRAQGLPPRFNPAA